MKPKLKPAIYIILAFIICWEGVSLLRVFSDLHQKREILNQSREHYENVEDQTKELEISRLEKKISATQGEIATKNITGTSTHEHSQETVYEDNNVICVEVRDDWSDPKAPHPITEVVHHTYDKETNKELTLLDVTGMSSEELANEIKGMLKEGYPELYERFWGNEDESYGFYAECFEKINPATLDFCISEDGKIEVYDQWGLDYATNPNGLLVYVTLKESVIYGI